MNILYVSHLPAMMEAGPSWSIPACVEAQSKIDNVLWINTNENTLPHWEKVESFHRASEFGKLELFNLPHPFNRPDVIVFEGMYDSFKEITFSHSLRKAKVPYIIVPRGSLTYLAMHNGSKIKKEIAHRLFYDKYIKGAMAIQYLTDREYEDSKYRFDVTHFILPNGIVPPKQTKTGLSKDRVKAVFIGRFDAFHKGIDLLLEACKAEREYLVENRFTLALYGTETGDWVRAKEEIGRWGNDFITIHSAVTGKEKEEVLLNSDVFIMTSRFEGHPMGLIEALSYGVSCLASDGTNMAEEIANYDAGWACKADVGSIRVALRSIIDNRASLGKKGENALLLSEQYNWSKLAMDFHKEVETLLQH